MERDHIGANDFHASMTDIAISYLRRGILVVPSVPGKKRPATPWKRVERQSEADVRQLFADCADFGILGVCGLASDLLVVDVDGPEAHEALVHHLGGEPVAPKALSGSREPCKYHLYFRHPINFTIAKFTPWHSKLEFRGRGGLIAMPPSLHPSGNRYKWVSGRSLDEMDRPEAPAPILDALARRVAERLARRTARHISPLPDLSERQRRARAYIAKMPAAVEGQGGDQQTFVVACRLVIGFALPVEEALPLLLEYNQRCQPPWNEKDLVHKLRMADNLPGLRGELLGGSTALNVAPPPSHHNEHSAKPGVFCTAVPDYVLLDYYHIRFPSDRLRPNLNRRWFGVYMALFAIKLCAVMQRLGQVIVPDVMFGQVIWGGIKKRWPANWRQTVLQSLRAVVRIGYLTGVSEVEYDEGEVGCPPRCPSHGSAMRHWHLRLTLNTHGWDEFELNAINPKYLLGALEFFGVDGEGSNQSYDFRSPRVLTPEQVEALGIEWGDPVYYREKYKRDMKCFRELRRSGRVRSTYLPVLLFGFSYRFRLSPRLFWTHAAIMRELTRDWKSKRPDKAEVFTGGKQTSSSAVACPLLEPGAKYVAFNGNGGRGKRRAYHGRGYSIKTWMKRSGWVISPDERQERAQIRTFFRNLKELAGLFGFTVAAWHPRRCEWLPLSEMISSLASTAGQSWLEKCRVRIFTEADFLIRWRRLIAEKLGFSMIPDQLQEKLPVQDPASSREQFLIYLSRAGLDRRQLASELGVSQSLVSRHLSGERAWTPTWQGRIAEWITRTRKVSTQSRDDN